MPQAPPSEDRIGALVYLAGVSWDDVRGTDQQLAAALSEHLPVLWVDPPASYASLLRSARHLPLPVSYERIGARMVRVRTTVPAWPLRAGVRSVAAVLERAAVLGGLRTLGAWPMATLITSPEPRSSRWADRPLVYYATDDFVAGAGLMGMSATRLRRAERTHVARSDALLAVTEAITQRWRGRAAHVAVLPNGCDSRFYRTSSAPAACVQGLERPVAGVVGQLSDRVDMEMLHAVVDQGIRLLLVGPRIPGRTDTAWAALLQRPGVTWLDRRPREELPGLLAAMDVGLVPYTRSAFNRSSFPLKTLEYLAAGLPVVASDLPAVSRLRAPDVFTEAAAGEFASRVLAVTRTSDGDLAGRAARQGFAASHDWDVRARHLLDVVTEASRG